MLNIYSLICADENLSRADWIVNSFPIIRIVIMCVLMVLSIMMMVLVLMQKSNNNGSAALTGQTDTFYSRNKKSTLQGKIKVMTIVVASTMMALCLIFMILSQIYGGTI
jgi:protein translocase SecG subunit